MKLEEYLKSLGLQIERFVPFEELPDERMRKLLSKNRVGFDEDADFICTSRVEISKFEIYGLAPQRGQYPVLIDVVRKSYIITKGLLEEDISMIYN